MISIRRRRTNRHNSRIRRLSIFSHKISDLIGAGHAWIDKNDCLHLQLPRTLDFERNYEESCAHLRVLRVAIEMGIKIRRIDFSQMESISTAAALVLVSTVDQWRERVGGRALKAEYANWNEDVMRLLCQMGYCEALKVRKPKRKWDDGNQTFLPFKKGKVGMDEKGPIARDLRVDIEKMVGARINRMDLYEGISEAITNVGHHAYKETNDEKRKYWWISGSHDRTTNELSVTFYDRGSGIPHRILKNSRLEQFWDAMGQWSDSKRIEAAMELGRTSTALDERGKGLQNFIGFAKSHKFAKMRIRSLRGLYEEEYVTPSLRSQETFKRLADYNESIGGTLIEWSVTLQS